MATADREHGLGDGFFARWSRRKAEQTRDEFAAPVVTSSPEAVEPIVEAPAPPVDAAAAPPAPTLEDVALLVPGDEISRFVRAGVDPQVKREAMKKLFADPHFNVMDGLDVYIDDYGRPDPIPAAMLRQMNQSKFLRLFDNEDEEERKPAPHQAEDASAPASAHSSEVEATAPVDDPATTPPDEDPDLQLQPDDPDRRPGAEDRTG
jgi:Protein of unknown function (DUF3306)